MKHFDRLFNTIMEDINKSSEKTVIKESQSIFNSDEEIYAAINQLDLNDGAKFEEFMKNVADYINDNEWDTELPRCLGLSNWDNIKTDIRYRKAMVKYLKWEINGGTVRAAIENYLTKPGNLDKVKDWIIKDSKQQYPYLYNDWKIKEDGALLIQDEDLYNIVYMILDKSENVSDFENEENMIDCKVLMDAESDAGQWGDSMLGFPIRGGDDWQEQEDFDDFLDSWGQVEYYKYNDEENWPNFAEQSVKKPVSERRVIKESKNLHTKPVRRQVRRIIKESNEQGAPEIKRAWFNEAWEDLWESGDIHDKAFKTLGKSNAWKKCQEVFAKKWAKRAPKDEDAAIDKIAEWLEDELLENEPDED